jgi:hypothetical protein
MQSIGIVIALIIGSILFWIVLYKFASPHYEKISLDGLPINQRKIAVQLLERTFASRLTIYHAALFSSLFGIFVAFSLLTQFNFSLTMRIGALWVGIVFVLISEFVLALTMIHFGALQVCLMSYEIAIKTEKTNLFKLSVIP